MVTKERTFVTRNIPHLPLCWHWLLSRCIGSTSRVARVANRSRHRLRFATGLWPPYHDRLPVQPPMVSVLSLLGVFLDTSLRVRRSRWCRCPTSRGALRTWGGLIRFEPRVGRLYITPPTSAPSVLSRASCLKVHDSLPPCAVLPRVFPSSSVSEKRSFRRYLRRAKISTRFWSAELLTLTDSSERLRVIILEEVSLMCSRRLLRCRAKNESDNLTGDA